MAYGVKLEMWGDMASFNRPEMKVERVSYDVITPSAARGVLEAIYWKPEMRWIVTRIHVLKPIRFTHVRRNEISNKIPVKGKYGVASAMKTGRGSLGIDVQEHRQQRAAMILRDVRYGIEAQVEIVRQERQEGGELSHPEAKHLEMFKRRANRGQCFHHPYLGVREFPASFKLVDAFPPCPPELKGETDLGLMLHEIAFTEDPDGEIIESSRGRRVRAEPYFFHARMIDGIIDVPSPKDRAESP